MYVCIDAAAVVEQPKHAAMNKSFKVRYATLSPKPLSTTTLSEDMPSLSLIDPVHSISDILPPLLSADELPHIVCNVSSQFGTTIDVSSHSDTITEEPPVKFENNRLIITDIPHDTSEDILHMFCENQFDKVIEGVDFSLDIRPGYTMITFANDYSNEGKLLL